MPKYVFNPESLTYEPAQEPRYKHLLRFALGVLDVESMKKRARSWEEKNP